MFFVLFFFFQQKTAIEVYRVYWGSDVFSSDLAAPLGPSLKLKKNKMATVFPFPWRAHLDSTQGGSEGRGVGKGGRQ